METKLVDGHYKIIVSEDDKNCIFEMMNKGIYDKDIAEYFKVSRQFISGFIRENFGKREHGINEQDEEIIIKLYERLKKQQYVCTLSGFSYQTVHRVLLKHNITINGNDVIGRKYHINENYFDVIDTPNKAYILGFLYADGCVLSNSSTIRIFLQERDKEILELMSKEMDSDYPLYYREAQPDPRMLTVQNQYGISINSKHMYSELIKKGVVPRKSLILTYPEFIPDELQKYFLRGYQDGDGGIFVYKNGGHTGFVGTEEFCTYAASVIKRLVGVNACVYKTRTENNKSLQISGNRQIKTYLDWLYSGGGLMLRRKYNHYLELFYNTQLENNEVQL